MWRVSGTFNDALRWRQMSRGQPIDDVINKAALHCCSLIRNSAECERNFSMCRLASAGNKGGESTKTILSHQQICKAAEIWKENEIQSAIPCLIPARLLNKSHKHDKVKSTGASLLPIVDEDFVDALLDNPWITSDDSYSEVEEELPGVATRKFLTFSVSEEPVVAWNTHNLTGLPGSWDKYCSRSIVPCELESVYYVVGNERVLANLYGGKQDW